MRSFTSLLALGLLATVATAAPTTRALARRQNETDTDRLVFAHFMMGIVANRASAADYDNDMRLAKAAGIDAFALNIGTDAYNEKQLDYAYVSAEANGMKVFMSFDFHYFEVGNAGAVATLVKKFSGYTGQLKVDNKVFVSSFVGDGLNPQQLRDQAGVDIYLAPNFAPAKTASAAPVDGALNWMAWDSDGANKAPKPGKNVTVGDGDATYTQWLGATKGYIAPISPWFSTHYGPEVAYSKNWVFPSDLLWYTRWTQILALRPRFVEILTWNDYGESHYVGPLASPHTDDGNSKWVHGMPHTGWLDMAAPFIAAYKAGKKTPEVAEAAEKLVYWYRPTPKTADCDATDTTMLPAADPANENYFMGRPDGHAALEDAVFVVALLHSAGTVTVSSGANTETFEAPAGASAWKVAMGVGKQTFKLERGGKEVLSETSKRDVSETCPCGIYNFNAYVGTVPKGEGGEDELAAEGMAAIRKGLAEGVKCPV